MGFGGHLRNGFEMAMKNLPANQSSKMKVFVEDDFGIPKNTIMSFEKLRALNDIDAVVCATSPPCVSVAPFADKHKIPMIGIGSAPEISRGHSHSVAMWPLPETLAKESTKEAMRRGYKNIVIVSSIQDAMLAWRDAVLKENNGQLKILIDEEVLPEERDLKFWVITVLSG